MANGSTGKILIVDDEVELKNVLVEALSSQGYEAAGFTSGEAALATLREEAFDVLLTDLMMPGMDGITLVRESLQIDPHLVCMVMTGQGTIQTAVDAMKEGAFDYVLKPFRLQTVLPVLTRAMNTRHMRLENLQLRETVAIYELGQTIAFTLDPQTVISKLADAALQQTDADEVSVLLPAEDGDELYVAAVRGEKRERLLGERVPLDESITGWVARERESLILDGAVNDQRFRSLCPHPEIRSAISIPMQVAGKLVGTININALSRPRPFTVGQMKALTILAGTAAAALESASLYSQVQRAEENYRSIFENAVEGIFQITTEGRLLTANPALARILGYGSPEEVIKDVTNVAKQIYVRPEDRIEADRREQEHGAVRGFEIEAHRKDGRKIWLSLNRYSVRDENGNELYREGSIEDITERKRAEEALRKSEERYRALVESLPAMIYYVQADPPYTPLYLNSNIQALGYLTEEWYRKPDMWVSVLHPDDREWVLHETEAAKIAGVDTEYEYRVLAKDGSILWLHDRGRFFTDASGTRTWQGVLLDITERKRAEEALRESEERYRDLVENSHEIICTHDLDGKILSVNRATLRLLGYEPSDVVDKMTIQDVLAPEVRDQFDRYMKEILEKCETTNVMLVQTRSGERRLLEYYNSLRTEGVEKPIVRAIARDITERRRAEEALRASEERYRDLVENAHDIIFSHDLKGNYTSVNRAGELITGYTHDECLALNIVDTIAPEDVQKARDMMAKKLAGESVTAYEVEILAKDGKRIAVEVNTKLIVQDGAPVGVQGIARDVTERKQLEDQLRQSQKMEAIGQLAGGVAHDFNNLLTAINGYSSLALQRLEDGHPVKSYLEEVKKAGERAANLTRQLLAFGRKQILQPLALDLNGVVSDLNKMLRRLIGEDIVLTAKLDPDVGKVMADPGQVEQVLVNLIVNARDAMPRGGDLTIETANVELDKEYGGKHVGVVPGDYVMLAVSDTGEGMSEEVRRRVFEPFFTTKEKGKGTGLGLSTVYGIVKQSGGNIWVYSEPGEGTTFKVYLPRVESKTHHPGETVIEAAPLGGSETILLVEDEDVVRSLARRILEQAGYSVVAASRGDEALRYCEEHTAEVDLLLTDVVMPEMSGKELADQLKLQSPELKMLFMSGYTDESIVHHGVLDSSVEFIQKPFTPTALVKKVREVLDAHELIAK